LVALAEDGLTARRQAGLRRVINATGIVLHTNLGRAPLAAAAVAEIGVKDDAGGVDYPPQPRLAARRQAVLGQRDQAPRIGRSGAIPDPHPLLGERAAQRFADHRAAVAGDQGLRRRQRQQPMHRWQVAQGFAAVVHRAPPACLSPPARHSGGKAQSNQGDAATMSIEQRLAAVETRLRAAEDKLEILDLLNSYGPLVDCGAGTEAAALWVEGGGYSFSGGVSGGTRLEAPEQLVAMYESKGHMALVDSGVSHFTGTPKITVDGDQARAVGYSFVILKEGERWFVWRAAINEWALIRTDGGWRIRDRTNRTLDGSPGSHELMRRVLA